MSGQSLSTRLKLPGRLTSAYQHFMALHWSMSWCYLILFGTGLIMVDLSRDVPIRSGLYDFHKGLGVLVLGLLLWRIGLLMRVWWKKYTRHAPRFSGQWWRKFALHTLLYSLMLAVPLTGFLLSNSYKSHNVFFLGVTVPDLFLENEDRVELGRSLHLWLSYTFMAFVILHGVDQRKVMLALWRRWKNFVANLRPQPDEH